MTRKKDGMHRCIWVLGVVACLAVGCTPSVQRFQLEEATINDIHRAIETEQVTAVELVHLYLDRVKAYNGTCVNQPEGILGPFSPIRALNS